MCLGCNCDRNTPNYAAFLKKSWKAISVQHKLEPGCSCTTTGLEAHWSLGALSHMSKAGGFGSGGGGQKPKVVAPVWPTPPVDGCLSGHFLSRRLLVNAGLTVAAGLNLQKKDQLRTGWSLRVGWHELLLEPCLARNAPISVGECAAVEV